MLISILFSLPGMRSLYDGQGLKNTFTSLHDSSVSYIIIFFYNDDDDDDDGLQMQVSTLSAARCTGSSLTLTPMTPAAVAARRAPVGTSGGSRLVLKLSRLPLMMMMMMMAVMEEQR